jgi:hypothetical protein
VGHHDVIVGCRRVATHDGADPCRRTPHGRFDGPTVPTSPTGLAGPAAPASVRRTAAGNLGRDAGGHHPGTDNDRGSSAGAHAGSTGSSCAGGDASSDNDRGINRTNPTPA